jgi:hypothetical protein
MIAGAFLAFSVCGLWWLGMLSRKTYHMDSPTVKLNSFENYWGYFEASLSAAQLHLVD